ncbi:DUF2157 domain-containing protein [Roseateles oligotrophus]|uniref:DUF2157 domain-containing protein n=1 Tax=Roseateles oligotrophus TaxID=1769250 RepID=A0ABT2YI86_9BURK|nr:DUF2157 domain-containing protein [Roseateles oligotrophus]MCV2369756.1 DUF2157 domain-containing protein [Roseateles oligotrophus]
MKTRLLLFQLGAQYGLDEQAARQLQRLAGLTEQPRNLSAQLLRGTALLAAGLAGLALVMWVAANWSELGRAGRFALLQTLLLGSALGAALWPKARQALAFLCLLSLGGLLAFFGQTYQTGADPWQLFALWAALGLPLCFGARSDLLWAPWAAITTTAIALWTQTHLGGRWSALPAGEYEELLVHALAFGALSLMLLLLGPLCRRQTGAGLLTMRLAMGLATTFVSAVALSGLFHAEVMPHYWLGLIMGLVAVALVARSAGGFDLAQLSMLALGLNSLLVVGFAHWLSPGNGSLGNDPLRLLLVGAVAALLLAGSVSGLLRIARRHASAQETSR